VSLGMVALHLRKEIYVSESRLLIDTSMYILRIDETACGKLLLTHL